MSRSYKKGDTVEWNWGNGTASGRVLSVHTSDITKTIKGTEVKRTASDDEPAYTIQQADGDIVLKSQSENQKSIVTRSRKYEDIDFQPPQSVGKNAVMGLCLRQKFDRGDPCRGRPGPSSQEREESFTENSRADGQLFCRHEIDKEAEHFGDHDNPSAGYVAWLLWGGDEGREWAEKIKAAIEEAVTANILFLTQPFGDAYHFSHRCIGWPSPHSHQRGPGGLDLWAYQKGVTLDFSRPGKPTDNAFIEAFNGRFRTECLKTPPDCASPTFGHSSSRRRETLNKKARKPG